METNFNSEELKYITARKKVKRIKGFYVHLMVYVVVNIAIIISKIDFLENGKWSFDIQNLSVAISWGIGLVAHGISVFLPAYVLGKDWEEKKINEIMEKEKNSKWE